MAFTMARAYKLLVLSLVHQCLCGLGSPDEKSEDVGDLKAAHSRVDKEQDPYTSVTVDPGADAPRSTLFAECLAKSRTFEAKFASIENEGGAEYIRYVPDTSLSFPVEWEVAQGAISNIFECTEAADEGAWAMFKYDGKECKVSNMSYDLSKDPECSEDESEAVFISSTATPYCPLPRFFIGAEPSMSKAVYAIFNENLMTFGEAVDFCSSYQCGEDNSMMLYVNTLTPGVAIADVIAKLQANGYQTNLWVDAKVDAYTNIDGGFDPTDFVGNIEPADSDPSYEAAYLNSEENFKLSPSLKSFKAGAVCMSSVDL